MRRVALSASVTFLLCLLSACAVNNVGAVVGKVLKIQGGYVVSTKSIGGQLRTHPMDAGLTLGYRHSIYIYPATGTDKAHETGDFFFYVPMPDITPVALDSWALGLELLATNSEIGISIGLHARSILADIPAGASRVLRLQFDRNDLAASRLSYCEEQKCRK